MPSEDTLKKEDVPDPWKELLLALPEKHRPNYTRLFREVGSLDKTDPMYQAIMALGYCMLIGHEMPLNFANHASEAERRVSKQASDSEQRMAKQMDGFERRMFELVRENDRRTDGLMWKIDDRTKKLEELHEMILNESFYNRIVPEALEMFEQKLTEYSNPRLRINADAYVRSMNEAAQATEQVCKSSQSAIQSLRGTLSTYKDTIIGMAGLTKEYRELLANEVVLRLEEKKVRHTRWWMLVAVISATLLLAAGMIIGYALH